MGLLSHIGLLSSILPNMGLIYALMNKKLTYCMIDIIIFHMNLLNNKYIIMLENHFYRVDEILALNFPFLI